MECRERRKGWKILVAAVVTGCIGCSPASLVPPESRAGTVTKPVSFAILEDYDKGQDLREVARDFSRFRELGIVQWRGSFGWDDYEPSPGRYDFDWLEKFVALADSMGISLRPYLGYGAIQEYNTGANFIYNSLQTQFSKQFKQVGRSVRIQNHRILTGFEIHGIDSSAHFPERFFRQGFCVYRRQVPSSTLRPT